MSSPVLIKACLNGARRAGSHPALPLTPEALAEAARAARAAGAGAVHVHVRDAAGNESLAAEDVARSVEAVRAACPGLPVGVSTGAWIEPDEERRLNFVKGWRILPDFASVNWREDGSAELAELLLDMQIGVEAGLFAAEEAREFAASPLAGRCLRALVEVRSGPSMTAAELASSMDAELDAAGVAVPRLHHGFGAETWPVIAQALRLGRDVRVGLEDTFTLPDGTVARDNADLVAAAVRMAREQGREAPA